METPTTLERDIFLFKELDEETIREREEIFDQIASLKELLN